MDFYDLLKYTGLPKRIRFDLKRLKLQEPSEFFDRSSYWYGVTGSGKSTFAGHILAESLKRFISMEFYCSMLDLKSDQYDPSFVPEFDHLFVKVPVMLRRIKGTFSKSYFEDTEYDIISRYSEAKFLVLDDIGIELTTDWAFQILYEIIDWRYSEMLPTIFTSNLPIDQLAEKLEDPRLVSRIVGMCGEYIYQMPEIDRRINED